MIYKPALYPNEFYYHKEWITIENVENVGNVVTIGHNQSSQEAVFQIRYNNEETFNNAEIENIYTQASVDLDVFKVDKTAVNKYLEGAVFTLKEIDETKVPISGSPVYKQDDHGIIQRDSEPTAETTGKTSFTNLTAGYYEISEKTAPDGYVLATDAIAYFKVEKGVVIRLEKDPEKKPSEWEPMEEEDQWISFQAAKDEVNADPENNIEGSEAQNAKFTIKNEPGAALPHTGGPGTGIFTILGSLLIAGAGLLLWRKRRTI